MTNIPPFYALLHQVKNATVVEQIQNQLKQNLENNELLNQQWLTCLSQSLFKDSGQFIQSILSSLEQKTINETIVLYNNQSLKLKTLIEQQQNNLKDKKSDNVELLEQQQTTLLAEYLKVEETFKKLEYRLNKLADLQKQIKQSELNNKKLLSNFLMFKKTKRRAISFIY